MMQRLPIIAAYAALLSTCLPYRAIAAPVVFTPLYNDGANEGFNDPTFGAARKSAFEHALGIYGGVFENRFAGEAITVRAEFNPLGGSGPLGSANPDLLWTGLANEPVAGVAYPSALASHLEMFDVNGGSHEIAITFNSDVDGPTALGGTDWYYGTNGLPGVHIDLVTVALHELGHGLGFLGFLKPNGAYMPAVTSIFDHFMNTSLTGGIKLPDLAALGTADSTRAGEVTGNDLYWDGAEASAANGGARAKLHAAGAFNPGSSLYHLSETALPGELMSPVYSGADHTISALERGMLKDMGWTLAAVPEASAWLFGAVASCFGGGAVLVQRFR